MEPKEFYNLYKAEIYGIIAIFAILFTVFSYFGHEMTIQSLKREHERNLWELRIHNVFVYTNTKYNNSENGELQLIPRVLPPNPVYNDDNSIKSWTYTYFTDDMRINTTEGYYMNTSVEIHIPIDVYLRYSNLTCIWEIKDYLGIIKRELFEESYVFSDYMYGYDDISSVVSQTDSPKIIEVTVVMSNA